MAKFLVTFNDQIDEIDLNGFMVMTEKELEAYEEMASSITWGFTFEISNYELEFSSGEDLLSRLDYKELSIDDAKSLKKLFNNEFGIFVGYEFLESQLSEETEFDDSEDDEDDEDEDFNDDDYHERKNRNRNDYDEDFDDIY